MLQRPTFLKVKLAFTIGGWLLMVGWLACLLTHRPDEAMLCCFFALLLFTRAERMSLKLKHADELDEVLGRYEIERRLLEKAIEIARRRGAL